MFSVTRFLIFGLGIYLTVTGTNDFLRDVRQGKIPELSVSECIRTRGTVSYVTLTDARFDLTQSIPLGYSAGQRQSESGPTTRLLIPILSTSDSPHATVSIVLETEDPELIFEAEKLGRMTPLALIQYISDHREKAIREMALTGRIEQNIRHLDQEESDKIHRINPGIRNGFLILKHRELPNLRERKGKGVTHFDILRFNF